MRNSPVIMDWLVHGGHQYEFFKTGPLFYCTNKGGLPPKHTDLGRPKNSNVKFVYEKDAIRKKFNIIMIRSNTKHDKLNLFRKLSPRAPGIAVMQTHTPFKPPAWTRCIVWNSKSCMDKHRRRFPRQKHFYIPHGFDPDEFSKQANTQRNDRILSVNSVFKDRANLLGFNEWAHVSKVTKKCDLLGHGNENLSESIGSFPLKKLVRLYNEYGVYLNTTTHSAMPRARGEALMCGMPMVTTNNFGISRYLKHNINCFFADNKNDMVKYCNKILNSKELQEDLSFAARECAIKYFHINDYVKKWKHVFEEALR